MKKTKGLFVVRQLQVTSADFSERNLNGNSKMSLLLDAKTFSGRFRTQALGIVGNTKLTCKGAF